MRGPVAALKEPEAWSRKELKALFNAAENATGKVGGVPNSVFFPAMLQLGFETAERVGAIRALRWEDVDFDNRWVLFRGTTRKGARAADNRQRISRQLRAAMLKLREIHQHPTPFGHVHLTSCYFHLKRIHKAAGLPADRHSMMHRLRRSHATHLYAAGGDATVSLGHSSDYITRKRYLDPRFIRKSFGADLLHGRLSRLLGWLRNAIGI